MFIKLQFMVLGSLVVLSNAGCLDRCSITSTKRDGSMKVLSLGDFENNSVKKNELVRTKVYFGFEKPVFTVINSGAELTFGHFGESTTLAIFTSQADYFEQRNPCKVLHDVTAFSKNVFVEVEFIVELTGRFSLIIRGGDTCSILSCRTGYLFNENAPTLVSVGHADNKEEVDTIYDCPL